MTTDSNLDAHVRIGWSTRQGPLQAPVGYDKWSFAYRDISGIIYFNLKPKFKKKEDY